VRAWGRPVSATPRAGFKRSLAVVIKRRLDKLAGLFYLGAAATTIVWLQRFPSGRINGVNLRLGAGNGLLTDKQCALQCHVGLLCNGR
jgi:hypothetical protein